MLFQCPNGIHFGREARSRGVERRDDKSPLAVPYSRLSIPESLGRPRRLRPSGIHCSSDHGGLPDRQAAGGGVSMPERHSLLFRGAVRSAHSKPRSCFNARAALAAVPTGVHPHRSRSNRYVPMPERHSLRFRQSYWQKIRRQTGKFQCPSGIHPSSDGDTMQCWYCERTVSMPERHSLLFRQSASRRPRWRGWSFNA